MGNVTKWVENTSQFSCNFIENYDEDSDEGYFLEVDVQFPQKLHEFYNDLPCLPERMKIEKLKNLQPSCKIKKEYVMHIRNLRQALNHRLV